MFFASDWSAKEGSTWLPHSASGGSTFKKLSTYFSGKPKVVWVIIELEYFNLKDSESEIKAKPQVKPDPETKSRKGKGRAQVCFFLLSSINILLTFYSL
jgi:hypothetical protein